MAIGEELKVYRCSCICELEKFHLKMYCTAAAEENQTKSLEQLVSDQQDLHVLRTCAICPVIKMGVLNGLVPFSVQGYNLLLLNSF